MKSRLFVGLALAFGLVCASVTSAQANEAVSAAQEQGTAAGSGGEVGALDIGAGAYVPIDTWTHRTPTLSASTVHWTAHPGDDLAILCATARNAQQVQGDSVWALVIDRSQNLGAGWINRHDIRVYQSIPVPSCGAPTDAAAAGSLSTFMAEPDSESVGEVKAAGEVGALNIGAGSSVPVTTWVHRIPVLDSSTVHWSAYPGEDIASICTTKRNAQQVQGNPYWVLVIDRAQDLGTGWINRHDISVSELIPSCGSPTD